MEKFLLGSVFFLHGLLHLLGFAKAFRIGNVELISSDISKPTGLFWMLAALVFVVAFALWMIPHANWSLFCLVGIFLSQILIILCWKDAKAGTIVNVLLLFVALPEVGFNSFKKLVEQEHVKLQTGLQTASQKLITVNDLQALPHVVQLWLQHSKVVGKPPLKFVKLKQTGNMKMKPGSDWMHFTASQSFNTVNPAFVWDARVTMMRGVFFTGLDRLESGKGSMQVKLFSLLNLVNEKDNPKINEATAQRFLAEMCWFPTAALSPYISWTEIDSLKAKAILNLQGITAEGIFSFKPNGEVVSFETMRYFNVDKDAKKEPWIINITGHKTFDGYYLPYRMNVTWTLKEGNFQWLNLEIISLDFTQEPVNKSIKP